MKWNKYTLKTTTEAIDYISGLMIELGIDGIQIEDNVPLSEEDKKAMFIDYLPTLPKDDVKRGEIYYISRGGYNTGSEQQADRPGVIVSNDKNNKNRYNRRH